MLTVSTLPLNPNPNALRRRPAGLCWSAAPDPEIFRFRFSGERGDAADSMKKAQRTVCATLPAKLPAPLMLLLSSALSCVASIITTLTATGWVDGEQRITNEAITATSTGLILLAPTVTTAQFNAFNNAAPLVVGQGAGWVDVQVFNVQPTVNIPIILMLWG